MQIHAWMKDRSTHGTLANAARRILNIDPRLKEAKRTFHKMCALEALLRSGGNQEEAANALGVTTHTVQRAVRSLGISASDFSKVAKVLKGRSHGKS
jgi:DNA-binding NtrC family response regulator